MTVQVPEEIIIDGVEAKFDSKVPLPKSHKMINKISDYPISSACWRGYVGRWEIKEGYLYLVELSDNYCVLGNEPILADWYTGIMKINIGKIIENSSHGYNPRYEKSIVLEIQKGKVLIYD